jgi:transposase
MRAMLIEIAWCWLKFQPQSALSKWFWQRFGHGGKRLRRIGIVAMARKLWVALWKYVQTGIPPEGAELVDWKGKLRQQTVSLTGKAA